MQSHARQHIPQGRCRSSSDVDETLRLACIGHRRESTGCRAPVIIHSEKATLQMPELMRPSDDEHVNDNRAPAMHSCLHGRLLVCVKSNSRQMSYTSKSCNELSGLILQGSHSSVLERLCRPLYLVALLWQLEFSRSRWASAHAQSCDHG